MKKIIVIITLLAIAISLCACSNDRVSTPTANALEATSQSKEPATIVLYAGDFTVIKTDWSKFDYAFVAESYNAVLEHNDKRVLVEIDAEQYACWDENDIVTGTLTLQPADNWSDIDLLRLVVGEENFIVRWSQLHEETK